MNYKEIIESRYNREAWQGLLHDIFHNNVKFWSNHIPIQFSSRLAKTALRLGNITLSDGENIAVYEVELNEKVDISRNKRGIRDMLTSDWRGMGYIGAFVFSYRKNESSLRFSYVSETWDFDKDGNYKKRSTDTMRYTYLLGVGRGCRTAVDRFTALKESKQTLNDITAAFSVETLTKLFYKDLFDWYLWAISPEGNISFPNNTVIEDDDREDLEKKIISGDRVINDMERNIESRCLSLITRQQPIAGDLRMISAALKVVTDIERIGDQTADIAELMLRMKGTELDTYSRHITGMLGVAKEIVHDAVDAFVNRDSKAADEVIRHDDVVDELFSKVKDDLVRRLQEGVPDVDACVDVLMIAKYLERIGDHAVNIAEWELFQESGSIKDIRLM